MPGCSLKSGLYLSVTFLTVRAELSGASLVLFHKVACTVCLDWVCGLSCSKGYSQSAFCLGFMGFQDSTLPLEYRNSIRDGFYFRGITYRL